MAKPPFTLEALDHVVLRVRDVRTMLDFYCRVLGCVLEKEQQSIGLWQLRAGSALIDLLDCGAATAGTIREPVDDAGRNMDHFCLRVAGYDEAAMRAWLQAQGANVGTSGTRYGAEGSGPSLYLFDPEGNQLELKASQGVSGHPADG